MLGMCIGAQRGACRVQQGFKGPEMKGKSTDFAAVANVFINYRLVTFASLRWTIKQRNTPKPKEEAGICAKLDPGCPIWWFLMLCF